ncbi:MAG TPA: helicase-associated domain-containing protein, partial [Planctomycetota bacterium]|nr:helicase-associated domain-containing protein [Planctomycetota bacterium]
ASVPPPVRPKPSSDCVNNRKVELTSREGRLSGDLAKFLLLLEQDPPSITQRGTMNRRDLARLARRGGIPDREVDLLGISAACLDAVETNDEVARISKSASTLLGLAPAELAKRLFEALPAVTFEIRYMWLAQSQFEQITQVVRSGLETRLVDTRTTVCAHCVAEELAGTRALLKELGHADEWAPKVARLVLNTLSHMYHAAGIVEAAIDSKGVTALRLTPTGEVVLGRVPVPPAVLPEEGPVIVQPSGEIIAPRSLPFDDLRRLARSCEVKGVDAVAVFALNRKSLLRAAQRGEDMEALRALLASRSKGPIPQTVKVLFDEIVARMGEIEILPCSAVVKLRDPSMIQALGPGAVALPEGLVLLPPDVDPRKVEADLRKQGHLPRMREAARREKQGRDPSRGTDQPDRSSWVATDLDEIWMCLEDAHVGGGAVEIRLAEGRVLSGTVRSLEDDRMKILPFFGGRPESVEIEEIESARPILRA